MTRSFGRAVGGGRRATARQRTSLLACLSTLSSFYQAGLVDLSATGARLRAGRLPPAGEEGSLQVGRLKLFGEVRWSHDGDCGFEFFEPLTSFQLAGLVQEYRRFPAESADDRDAREKWQRDRVR